MFGLIFSRWPAYGEAEAKAIIARFVQEGMPLSALVLDMEWHLKGWCRWDWNPDMYPEPEAFFRYLYTAARRHHDTGWPIVRGLFLEYPNDPAAYRFDQFLFGDALLVAPVLAADNHRRVYLPEGDWFPFEGGEVVSGPREIEVIAGLDEVPLYARVGSVVVRCAQNATPGLGCWPGLRLDVFPGPQGSATLYEDDGRTSPPATSDASLTRFNLHATTARIELDYQPAALSGLDRRNFEIDLRLAQAPGAASLDGQPLDTAHIQFDPARQRCLISMHALPADKAWTLVVTMAET